MPGHIYITNTAPAVSFMAIYSYKILIATKLILLTAVTLLGPSNKAYGVLRDKHTFQLKSVKIYVVYPPYARPYIITELHVCASNTLGNTRSLSESIYLFIIV